MLCAAEDSSCLTTKEPRIFGKLPRCRFSKSKNMLEVHYLSNEILLDNAETSRYQIELSNRAIKELAHVLMELKPRILKYTSFDANTLLSNLQASLAFEIRDENHAKELGELAKGIEFPEIISKAGAHATAKRLLNEDFYWSEGDVTAPHGNDYGMDVWLEYKDSKIAFGKSTLKFLSHVIQDHGAEDDTVTCFLITYSVIFGELKWHGKIGSKIKELFLSRAEAALKAPDAHESWNSNIRKSVKLIESIPGEQEDS